MLTEAAQLAEQFGDTPLTSGSMVTLGQAYLIQGKPSEAERYLRKGLKSFTALELSDQAYALAWLGAAQLAQGKIEAALQTTRKAVKLQKKFGLLTVSASDFPPQEISWWHYAALAELMKEKPSRALAEEAWETIDQAREIMLARVATLSDDGLRRNYFNKIGINSKIIKAWLEQAALRKMPFGNLTDHLSISSDIQEPFKRLIEIGVRMNTRRNTEELAPFIINEVVELTGAERAALFLNEGDNFKGQGSLAAIHLPVSETQSVFLQKIQPILKETWRSGQPVLRFLPEKASTLKQRSILCVPLTTAGKIVGSIYAEMDGLFGRFSNLDLNLLKVLANQAAVAIENTAWARTLEDKVDQRTAELQASKAATEQRNAELAVINSVQQGLAAEMEFQAIVDLVGDKLREVLNTGEIMIRWYESQTNLVHYLYCYEHGKRIHVQSAPPITPAWFKVVETRQPLILNTLAELNEMSGIVVPGTDTSLSMVMVPIIGSDQVIGTISIENYEKEYAFSEANVRLLQTVASSMGVALENARLFEETQQRNSELALINSIQQGLAAELNFQSIVDLVGDKLREIFKYRRYRDPLV